MRSHHLVRQFEGRGDEARYEGDGSRRQPQTGSKPNRSDRHPARQASDGRTRWCPDKRPPSVSGSLGATLGQHCVNRASRGRSPWAIRDQVRQTGTWHLGSMVCGQCQISLRQIFTRRGKPGYHAPVLGDFEGLTRLHALKVATQVLSQLSNSYFRHCASHRSTLTESTTKDLLTRWRSPAGRGRPAIRPGRGHRSRCLPRSEAGGSESRYRWPGCRAPAG